MGAKRKWRGGTPESTAVAAAALASSSSPSSSSASSPCSPTMTVPPNFDWSLSLQWNADLEKFRDFRVVLLYYKCRPCLQYRGHCLGTLDCPGFHSDMDRRRSPAQFHYDSTPCVRVKPSRNSSWKEPSVCPLRDSCTFCHTRAEQQLHPDVYRTVRCRDQLRDGRCPRLRFCAFSHNDDELQELIDFWQAYKRSNQAQLLIFSPSWHAASPSSSPPQQHQQHQQHHHHQQQQQQRSPLYGVEKARKMPTSPVAMAPLASSATSPMPTEVVAVMQATSPVSSPVSPSSSSSPSSLSSASSVTMRTGQRSLSVPAAAAARPRPAVRLRSAAISAMATSPHGTAAQDLATSSDESPEPSPPPGVVGLVHVGGCVGGVGGGGRVGGGVVSAAVGTTAAAPGALVYRATTCSSWSCRTALTVDLGNRLDRLSMAIDRAVASETSREPRIETCLHQRQLEAAAATRPFDASNGSF